MSFTQGAPTQPLSILASNVFLTGSSTAGNAFTVQQLGAGNVASFQTSTSATSLIINPSGQVGIGKTNPGYALDVTGDLNFTGTFRQNGTPYVGSQWTGTTSLYFVGNVGIGTNVPSCALSFGATTNNKILCLWDGNTSDPVSTGYSFYGFGVNSNYLRFQVPGSGTTPSDGFYWYSANTERMRIQAGTGNVGIGTNNPSRPLVVRRAGAALTDTAIMVGNNGTGTGVRFQTYDLTADANAWMGLGTDMGGNGYEHCLIFPYGSSNQGRQSFGTFDGTTYSTKMTILGTGNVGIGTATPYSICHIYNPTAGNPLTSGTNSDPSTILRVHCVTCGLDFGYLGAGGAWIQNRQVTASFGTNFPINLNPNGGGVAIGTPISAASYTLQVAGTVGASTSFTRITGSTGVAFAAPGTGLASTDYNLILTGANDTANRLVCFVNGSARTADNGISNVTIRNDAGSLFLGQGANPTVIFGNFVGIGTSSNFNSAFKHNVYGGDGSYTLYGPNVTWGAYLCVGAGPTYCGSLRASVTSSNGNLHLDCATGACNIYLNYFQGGGSGGTNATVGCYAAFTATGDITAFSSDERLKTKVGLIENALDKVCSLTAFKYIHNETARQNGFTDDNVYVGLSAQEVQKVLPEVVKPAPFDQGTEYDVGKGKSKSGENYLTVQYERIVSLLVEAVKEERAERLKVEERLARLEKLLLKE